MRVGALSNKKSWQSGGTTELTALRVLVTIQSMIETISFLLGLGFSVLVYFHSIRPGDQPRLTKAVYFFFTLIGITGTLFLSGVLIAHFLRKWEYICTLS